MKRDQGRSKSNGTSAERSKIGSRYPSLGGCYVEERFERKLTREFLGATVEIRAYKGAMLLRVTPEAPKKGEKHRCACPSIKYPSAWLRGDDLDAMIEVLREAKRVWLCAYRRAAGVVAKRARIAERAERRESSARARRRPRSASPSRRKKR